MLSTGGAFSASEVKYLGSTADLQASAQPLQLLSATVSSKPHSGVFLAPQ